MFTTRSWSRLGLYGALIVAWTALLGSLYFSEVRGFAPCTLCWYQRIFMYPLAGLIALGIFRRDRHLPHLVLPFSLAGQGVSVYHFLLQKTDLLGAPATCGAGVTCSTVWINWYGFVTIPLLAMAGFMAITMGMLLVVAGEEGGPNPQRAYRWPRWPVPLFVVAAIGLFVAAAVQAGKLQITLPVEGMTLVEQLPFSERLEMAGLSPASTAAPDPTATPTNLESGQVLYLQGCSSCHGANGVGVEEMGTPLADSPTVAALTDSELASVIREGRASDADDNRSGLAMPPLGGLSELTDEQIGHLVLYLRELQ